MNRWEIVILGLCSTLCLGREPFKPRDGSVPFLVYFLSRYRGLCVGTLLSRTTVVTASVCVADPTGSAHDTRAINVVTAATYRHPRRGIRVQVTKIILPKLPNTTAERAYTIQKSPAILLLARKVPDVLAEIPLRPITIDYKGDEALTLHEECLMPGWHFFYKGDKIYPIHKFLLQRNIRVQYLIIVKKSLWCNTVTVKFQKAMTNLGYTGYFDKTASVCVKDPDREAQPCHGMYGAPLVCHGKAVGVLSAPDAQWANCTGFTNLVHLFSAAHIRDFMTCVSGLFAPEFDMNWETFKKDIESDASGVGQYDYLPDMYDRLVDASSSDEV
ncbi:unnamed protein product [Euphydryas editha]|uniref:Peptidase S1 domain-containing protein n=1 Tax=Euphydryas editha TaxID=104508 RepID=A0AAU9V203_EUPED|nr:unnamed protein product [Euphydryas editha]